MYNLVWSRKELTRQKLGTFCEYYAKMALASYGLSIYTSEVDDHGIDFVAESNHVFLKFQVKAIRTATTSYVYMPEEHFDISDEALLLFLVLLTDGEHPDTYLIPATTWKKESKLFVYHAAYEGKKSNSEYALNLSAKNKPELEPYRLGNMIPVITGENK